MYRIHHFPFLRIHFPHYPKLSKMNDEWTECPATPKCMRRWWRGKLSSHHSWRNTYSRDSFRSQRQTTLSGPRWVSEWVSDGAPNHHHQEEDPPTEGGSKNWNVVSKKMYIMQCTAITPIRIHNKARGFGWWPPIYVRSERVLGRWNTVEKPENSRTQTSLFPLFSAH